MPPAPSRDGFLAAVDDQKGGVFVIELATGHQRAPLKTSKTDLQQLGIVAEMTGQRRNRVFCFREYYRLFLS